MDTRNAMRITPQIIFGLGIIAIGVVLLLHNMGIIYASSYFSYWPVILILIGLASSLQPSGSAGRWVGLVLLILGVLLLLDNLYIIDFYVWDYWPVLLILAGLGLIRGRRKSREFRLSEKNSTATFIRGFAVLGGQQVNHTGDDFQGGNVSAVLGGCKIDLRSASIKGTEAVLDVFTFWGGIEILVPSSWAIQVEGFPILGGFEDKTHPSPEHSDKKLVVRGTAIMGGIEIKN